MVHENPVGSLQLVTLKCNSHNNSVLVPVIPEQRKLYHRLHRHQYPWSKLGIYAWRTFSVFRSHSDITCISNHFIWVDIFCLQYSSVVEERKSCVPTYPGYEQSSYDSCGCSRGYSLSYLGTLLFLFSVSTARLVLQKEEN